MFIGVNYQSHPVILWIEKIHSYSCLYTDNRCMVSLKSRMVLFKSRDLDITYEKTIARGTSLILSGIVAKGVISDKQTGVSYSTFFSKKDHCV